MDLHIDKKPRLEECNPITEYEEDEELLQDIKADIDLEIGLRQRLLTTVEARIEWAELLCQALESDNLPDDLAATIDFKSAALNAFSAIEAPIEVLFSRDVPAPSLHTRPVTRKKPTLRTQLPKKSVKFLYTFLDNSAAPSILRCPLCFRTDFNSLQGLFNHARGTHDLGWSSHEECVRHCACTPEELDDPGVDFTNLELGSEVSFGSGGMGLRGIFELAVGGDAPLDFEGETALSRTLGLHSQTPALASFLGKQPIRRGVTVWDPEADVDIDGAGDDTRTSSSNRRWRMPFSHRNVFKDMPVILDPLPAPPATDSATTATAETRFHVTTRVVVADRSLWIPTEARTMTDTHKWMISIDAPSYARHITTVLERLVVHGPTGQLSTTSPPYVIIGTAREPFLAKIELYVGASENKLPQQIMLEHWVELDGMQSRSVAFGEEQMVDLDLHRTTVFLPQRTGYIPVHSRALWDMDIDRDRRTTLEAASVLPPVDLSSSKDPRNRTRNVTLPKTKMLGSWENALRALLERFPLTLQDVKGGKTPVPALPYRLVTTPKKFSSLVLGRRKAIEWGRSAAMCAAYNEALKSGLTEDTTVLTTADVFSWLHTNGHFPRGAAAIKHEQTMQSYKVAFCSVCGLSFRAHCVAVEGTQSQTMESFTEGSECKIITAEWRVARMPMVDAHRILKRRPASTLPSASQSPTSPHSSEPPVLPVPAPRNANNENWDSRSARLALTADPHLVRAICRQTERLGLRTFPSIRQIFQDYPLPVKMRTDIAPHAMLAITLKPFIRALINTALAVSTQDNTLARQLAQVEQRGKRNLSALEPFATKRMLMPSHVLRGVVGRSWDWSDQSGMAIMGVVSRLGVPLERPPGSAPAVPPVATTPMPRQLVKPQPSRLVVGNGPRPPAGSYIVSPSYFKTEPPPRPAIGTGWIPADATFRPSVQPRLPVGMAVSARSSVEKNFVQVKTEQD
ncbi:hypothetical protein MIND_00433900 [Mycena indigotica]|uniref:YEATS domain-containing protein n=1 Tax=Mycena indigotica TaxID=2126181 RepID=A0A8H6SX42_9AGAR|nr:uncharacterized protein MIND_00433900 [Mycena indigotica]KAF7306427.1 hypothetical protein MIND_00433900 [Mycena indigotica]